MSIPSRKKNVRDLELRPGTAALVRVDYNVPFEPGTLNISDDSRIAASVETIQYLKSAKLSRHFVLPPRTPARSARP